ncbi:uncharacterized protein LOC110818462 [Carica papaya]|uniref:uncharacterized protein LOC110818462 n=1 Tax=Carica papaya TaxID=3649 RepID=UPI000B8CE074|nr:uncharacterized protein LOC110818462 [Carica papaya]
METGGTTTYTRTSEAHALMVEDWFSLRGDLLDKTRGSLMVVATVIATMSFQVAVNPPGGTWSTTTVQEDGCPVDSCKVGSSIIAYTNRNMYVALIISSTASFSSSLGVILLLVMRPKYNKS